ncbi:MAG TPA: cytochrome c3 family protein [Candidatus Dormibacteraeota bacterium]|nr:cytochrome c3 family protein [Candidatus Dormibacteraeota bacterium]
MGWSVVAILLLALGGSVPALAAATAPQNATCLACHGQPGATGPSGRSISVSPSHFAKSVHSSLSCTSCHTSITGYPHPATVQPVQCGTCHSTEASDVTASVHAKVAAVPCLGCHGNPHEIVPATDSSSPVYPLNVPRTCGTCHSNPAMAKQYGLPNVYSMYMDSIHGFALTKEGLLVAASCSSCHGTHKILSHTNPQSRTYRTNIPDTCGTCHEGPKVAYFAGIHGQRLKAGDPRAPTCTDCHTAHHIAQVETVAWQMKTSATCGNCHKQEYVTYLDTFHAQVSALGYTETAHCWNCHGNHDILPPSNPQSTVNPANLVTTCGRCHAGASERFVSYQPHADPRNRQDYPLLWTVTLFMNLLLISVLGFFGIHTVLWFIRSTFSRQSGGRRQP